MRNKKHIIFEILLIAIIAIQSIFIYNHYWNNNENLFAVMNKTLDHMACANTLKPLLFFDDSGDFVSLLKLAEFLAENGYEKDRFVHQMLAKGYYVGGDKEKSANMLKKAIDANNICEFIEPVSEVSKLMDTAIAHFQLSEIYREIGQVNKSSNEYVLSIEFAKKAFKNKYSEKVVQKVFEQNSFKNINS